MTSNLNQWFIFDDWALPARKALSWNIFDRLVDDIERLNLRVQQELQGPLAQWNTILSEFGGDPSSLNLTNFRPLRITREEDWSAWLGHLIEYSETGFLACALLQIDGMHQADYAKPALKREDQASEGFRADLIIQWQTQNWTHIEVKVGDPHLEKTLATGLSLRRKRATMEQGWSDFLLILDWQRDAWTSLVENQQDFQTIKVITWINVVIALRKSLSTKSSRENILWRAWAYTFTGAVEQNLLGIEPVAMQKHIEINSLRLNILRGTLS